LGFLVLKYAYPLATLLWWKCFQKCWSTFNTVSINYVPRCTPQWTWIWSLYTYISEKYRS
jgi:hypothetical protein